MRKLMFAVVAVVAVTTLFTVSVARADQCIRVGNTIYGNCFQQRVPQRNVRTPFTQQNVHGRQVVIPPPPPRHGHGYDARPVVQRPVGMRTSVPSQNTQNTLANPGPKFRAFQEKNCVGADFAGMDINPETGKRGYHCVTGSRETVREVWD